MKDPDHLLLIETCAQRLDYRAILRRFGSNPAVLGVRHSLAMNYKNI